MKKRYTGGLFLIQALIFLILSEGFSQNFSQSQLNFNGLGDISDGVTSLMYGPDGRLYVAEYPGTIKILTIQRNGPTNYEVIDVEVLTGVKDIVNHDDDGQPCSGTTVDCSSRETTGITVGGTASNPIIYVTSSDFRVGAGPNGGNGDLNLDTNSGVITRFTWNGTSWDMVDLVRGLPRSEENHAISGLEITTINGTEHLIVTSGGFTNGGSPSANFVYTCEYALAGAILSVNLDAINSLPIQTDNNGRPYIYNLPTLDDPSRPNVNGIADPDDPGYDGIDVNDPWGGNDGLNQAMVVPGGPVQILSPGYRNAYDLVVTESGALYATDNGANAGWGGLPINEGTNLVNNDYDPTEPGSQSDIGGESVDNKDHLELITTDLNTYIFGSFYAGHPNPVRANPNGAGLFTAPGEGTIGAVFRTQVYDPDGSTPGSTTNPNIGLPANWPPIQISNPIEGDWRGPSVPNPDGPDDNPVVIWGTNTNGIDEYTASNFNDAMKGDLLAGHNGGNIRRVELNNDGSSQNLTVHFLSGIGGNALGITCNGDNEIFPGTIWAGTLNGLIVVFEPQDFIINCDNPESEPTADFDNDGYTNQDELDNGTDPCNGGSQPSDFDKSAGAPLVSDLNDSDDDNDGIPDALDSFQLGDPQVGGSDAFTLPISNDLFNDQQGLGGIFGLGMTGLMNNGDTEANWMNWLDDRDNGPNPNDVLGGAPGIMTSHMTEGTALGSSNNQDKGYQYGVQVDNTTGKFTVAGGMNGFTGPLRLYENTDGVAGGELGFFIGDGTQSNYIKFVVTTDGFTALQEINDVPGTPIETVIPVGDRPTGGIRFYFMVDPDTGTVDMEYQIDDNPRTLLGQIIATGTILQAIQTSDADLAVGFIGTSNTPGKELEGSWDFLNVFSDEPTQVEDIAVRVNASGVLVSDSGSGVDWQSNTENGATSGPGFSVNTGTGYPSGLLYANRHASIPAEMDQATFEALFERERYDNSSSPEMEYSFPLPNGDYLVNIFAGNSFSGTSQVGDRVFDIMIEGQLLGDNIDLVALFGHQSGGMLSYQTQVQDGELNVQFIHEVENPLVNAIEILSNVPGQNPIVVQPIEDQNNNENDILDGSLGVVASGGDGNLAYSAINLPPGVFIEPTNGQIGGSIDAGAGLESPYSVTIQVDDTDGITSDAVTIQFDWIISTGNLLWTDKGENENYTARHENSFVQAGDKFYVMGGRENATSIDVYDYASDTWAELTGNTPIVDGTQLEFNHFQATEYQGLIWVIGAFKSNTYPNEVPAEYVWMFDPANQEWIQGPQIPAGRRRGSAGLAMYNEKFYIVGGNNDGHDGGYVAQFDEYDPATGTWTPLADAPRARDHFSAVVIGDKLYAAGGRLSGGTGGVFKPVIPEVDVYDFTSGTWSTLPSGQNIPTPRAGVAAVNFNNKLVVIGGEVNDELVYGVSTDDALPITEEYDPVTQTWDRLPDMNYERQGFQAIVSGPGIHVLGGSPNRGGGNQKNLEFLGEDNPVGTPSIASTPSVPNTVIVNDGETVDIDLDIIDGNIGVFISSMEISGANAADYSIVSGELSNVLLNPNSTHTFSVELSGTGADRTAILTINYNDSSSLGIALTNNPNATFAVTNPGDQNNYEGDDVSLQIEATSPNITTYSATGLPPNLNINESTGLITGTIDDGFVSGGGDSFIEESGLVIIEAESGDTAGWDITNADGETGIVANTNSFNSISGNTISYEITISTPGVYRFDWRNFFSGPTPADENDSWLRFPNNADVWFFGIDASTPEGAPANEAEIIANLQGAQSEIVFPIGSSRITASTTPDGAGSNGYFKVYRSGGVSETYDWQARTSDNDNHNIYVWFVNPGTFTMDVSERSSGHAIDRMALYKVDTYGYNYSETSLTNAPESQQGGGVSGPGAAENSPYNVSVTVTDDGDPAGNETVDFLWFIENNDLSTVPEAVVSATPASGDAPLEINFTGSNSTDDVGVVSYEWDFGDGSALSNEADPVHTYTVTGTYDAVLTVTDGDGQMDTDMVTITVNAGSTGVIWLEDFEDLANGATVDIGATAWTSVRDGGTFEVSDGRFLANAASDTPGVWTSEVIAIGGTVSVSVDVDDADDRKEAADFVRALYILDGGAPVEFGFASDDIDPQTFTASGLSGSTVQIVIEMIVSGNPENYLIDNIAVTGESTGGTTYALTVNNGSGDGNYESGEVVNIVADAAPSGEQFDAWTGDVGSITDINSASTTVTMPSSAVNVTATYSPIGVTTYALTVNNGSGDGSYESGEVVNIVADAAPSGQQFEAWTGDVGSITDINSASTTVTMPSSAVSVTATYGPIPSGGTIWLEDFEDLANGATVDNGATAWTSVRDGGIFEVSDGRFLANAASDTPGVWTSEVIAIGGTVSVSVDVDDADDRKEAADYVRALYILDGGAPVEFGFASDDIDPQTFTASGLSGSTVQIVIEMIVSGNPENYLIDNIAVTGESTGGTTYTLTVNNGSGDGNYESGEVVNIVADTAPSGEQFDTWTGDVGSITDINSASTTVTMPSSAVNVTATYSPIGVTTYALTVNNGSGDGSYESGEVVNIVADAAPSGQQFEAWTGDVGSITDINSASTTVTMPSSAVSVTATYGPIPSGGTIWLEDFEDLANGATVDIGATAWTSVRDGGTFEVSDGRFLANAASDTPGVWTSKVIAIGGTVSISVDVDDADDRKETSDYVRALYILDSGAPVEFGFASDDIDPQTFTASGLSGSTVQIVIEMIVSGNPENYLIDNVAVTGSSPSLTARITDNVVVGMDSKVQIVPYEIMLYPNPGTTEVTLSTNGSSGLKQIQIFNSSGQLVGTHNALELRTGQNTYVLSINNLQSGVYHLNILTEDGETYFKQLAVKK